MPAPDRVDTFWGRGLLLSEAYVVAFPASREMLATAEKTGDSRGF